MRCPVYGIIVRLLAAASLVCGENLAADLVINDHGRVDLRSKITVNHGDVIIRPGGRLVMYDNAELTATVVRVFASAQIGGCGVINAALINAGVVLAACGPSFPLIINGATTNDGAVHATHDTQLMSNGIFMNNGLLDIITGAQIAPASLVNLGEFWDAARLAPEMRVVGEDVVVEIPTVARHRYQLQGSETPSGEGWQEIGPPQFGIDGTLIFTHAGGAAGDRWFYRIHVSD